MRGYVRSVRDGSVGERAEFIPQPDQDKLGSFRRSVDPDPLAAEGQTLDTFAEVGPRGHYLGASHTRRHMKTAFHDSRLLEYRPYETWAEDGSPDTFTAANRKMRQMLNDYQAPALDPAIDEALKDFIARKKAALPDKSF